MPPPPPAVPGLAGVGDLKTLMLAIDKQKDVKAFLKEYDAVTKRYEEAVKTYGTLAKVEQLQKEAEKEHFAAQEAREVAEGELESAKVEAKQIIADVHTSIATKKQRNEARANELDALSVDLQSKAAAFDESSTKEAKRLESEGANLAKRIRDVEAREAEVAERLAELETFTSRLRA
jgi:hypothetical protein